MSPVGVLASVGRSLMTTPCPPTSREYGLPTTRVLRLTNSICGPRQNQHGRHAPGDTQLVSVAVGVETVQGAQPLRSRVLVCVWSGHGKKHVQAAPLP